LLELKEEESFRFKVMIVCPNCGYKQAGGDQCQKCSSLFAYYQGQTTPPSAPIPAEPARGKAALSWARQFYRITTWASLAILVVAILMILRKSPAPQIPANPQAAKQVEEKLAAVETAAAAGQSQPLRLDQDELNAFLSSSLALQPPAGGARPAQQSGAAPADPSLEEVQSSVKDVKVTMEEDRVQGYVVFNLHGVDLSLDLEGRLHAEDGYLRFEPTGGKLGSLPIPQSTLETAVKRLLDSPENKEKLRLPDSVRDIRVENGELVVTYR
jgi:hypothetical protein